MNRFGTFLFNAHRLKTHDTTAVKNSEVQFSSVQEAHVYFNVTWNRCGYKGSIPLIHKQKDNPTIFNIYLGHNCCSPNYSK